MLYTSTHTQHINIFLRLLGQETSGLYKRVGVSENHLALPTTITCHRKI